MPQRQNIWLKFTIISSVYFICKYFLYLFLILFALPNFAVFSLFLIISYFMSHYLLQRVTEIRGQVNGSVIQCEFNIPNVNATNIRTSQDTTLQILLGTGEFDGSKWTHINTHCTWYNFGSQHDVSVETTSVSLSNSFRFYFNCKLRWT